MDRRPDSTIEWVLEMNDREFRSLVDDDLRGNAPRDLSAALRSPEVIERWFTLLKQMQKKADGDLAAKRAEINELRARHAASPVDGFYEKLAALHKWQKNSIFFRTGLDTTVIEASRLAREQRATARNERRILVDAIREHRASFAEDGDPDDEDIRLWRTLDKLQP